MMAERLKLNQLLTNRGFKCTAYDADNNPVRWYNEAKRITIIRERRAKSLRIFINVNSDYSYHSSPRLQVSSEYLTIYTIDKSNRSEMIDLIKEYIINL